MSASAIEWTDEVWNPVTGCDRVSPGCAHCYALELAPRLRAMQRARGTDSAWVDAPDGTRTSSGPAFGVQLLPERLEQPLRWRKPRRVFVNSMSDLFHEDIPNGFIAAVFGVMAAAPDHTFQILTKRPERMRAWFDWYREETREQELSPGEYAEVAVRSARMLHLDAVALHGAELAPWPLPNVWLGVSIENRRYVHRADVLRDTPAAVRFISAEPLLGPLVRDVEIVNHPAGLRRWADDSQSPSLNLKGIDWLIAGGESGPRHRPMRTEWVRDLRDAAQHAGTAFFFKQWGGRTPKAGGCELDGRTWDEMPVVTVRA